MANRSNQSWAKVNRMPGESYDSWMRRNREFHNSEWQHDKIRSGDWLPPEEYERLTGRPGRKLSSDEQLRAALERARKAEGSGATSASSQQPAPPRVRATAASGMSWRREAGTLGVGAAAAGVARAVGTLASNRDAGLGEVAKQAGLGALEGGIKGAARKGVEHGIRKAAASVAARQAGRATAKAATKTVARAATKALAKEAGKATVKRAAGQVALQAARTAARSNLATQTAFLAVEQVWDTGKLIGGSIDAKEYGRRSAENAGSAAGGLGGAAGGAAIGSLVFPGVGTVVGGIVGGILGSVGGGAGARKLVRGKRR